MRNKNKGFILIAVLIFTSIVLILTLNHTNLLIFERKISNTDINKSISLLYAKSGLILAKNIISNDNFTDIKAKNITIGNGKIVLWITSNNSKPDINFCSKSKIESILKINKIQNAKSIADKIVRFRNKYNGIKQLSELFHILDEKTVCGNSHTKGLIELFRVKNKGNVYLAKSTGIINNVEITAINMLISKENKIIPVFSYY